MTLRPVVPARYGIWPGRPTPPPAQRRTFAPVSGTTKPDEVTG